MKIYEVVGFERKTGDYQGTTYDNVTFYCLVADDGAKGLSGNRVDTVKIKKKNYDGGIKLGDKVMFMFGKYGGSAEGYQLV